MTELQELIEVIRGGSPAIPFDERLWNAGHIAEYLCRSAKDVSDNVTKTPGFPKPVEIVTSRCGTEDTFRGRKLWKAIEVVDWVDQFRKIQGRPRIH